MIFRFDVCAECACKYTAASPPFLLNRLHPIHLCHYSECSWDPLQLILIYCCYLHEGGVEAQQVYTLDSSIPWFAQANVPERI